MCIWAREFCTGRGGTCQTVMQEYRESDCGQHHDANSASGWRVYRRGVCEACQYPTPPSDGL
ncbi:hypothetical protein K469DRAFT_346849 [Zopfia rhizophila CBS 207.26]|uniref:Uncharacterized protein n=1 Tax=Zopfia rhizophila CBS 207.26 TaxID=1314779 RepID=A0A6A6ELV9_9PEZI|nr:hypothetical protein K469DRAFT_346849 [Zopfia rhizophila CBS 207.26]